MRPYEGKRVVITGGTSGIGLATAELLLEGGASVLVTGRTPASMENARAILGPDAIIEESDAVSGIDALVGVVSDMLGGVDLLVLNAGGTVTSTVEATTEAEFDQLFALNTKAPYFHRAEVPAVDALGQRRGADDVGQQHPGRRDHECLLGDQGGTSVHDANVRARVHRPGHPRQRRLPRPHRHRNPRAQHARRRGATVPRSDQGGEPDGAVRRARGGRQSDRVPRVRRDVHHGLGAARGRRGLRPLNEQRRHTSVQGGSVTQYVHGDLVAARRR
ncbi:short-chain dehydrogenase/reductase sdr [Mycolicibacterium vaccae ATCC 25954]|uniref:Short-chain dehydrogenase/reductase sdr n=1 Tax=Mycolicibacterium vaccae ATCC 25954 TaxID=1194972 RepID=K0UZI4_MYCVA|nr:short-chain dehydrogenase/reductase sdr [Mycolicibacterium vaccae ATCC 25954]